MHDNELFQRLRASTNAPAFPSDFQREVWSRIQAAEGTLPAKINAGWQQFLGWIGRPVQAVCLALVMGAAGCVLAAVHGKSQQKQLAEAVYVKSVSPFAAVHFPTR